MRILPGTLIQLLQYQKPVQSKAHHFEFRNIAIGLSSLIMLRVVLLVALTSLTSAEMTFTFCCLPCNLRS